MDTWNPKQLKKMQSGGNTAFLKVVSEFGLSNTQLKDKYNSKALEWYRNCITAAAESTNPPAPPSISEGKLPVYAAPAMSYTPPASLPQTAHASRPVSPPPTDDISQLFSSAVSWVGSTVQTAAKKVNDDGWAESFGSAINVVADKSMAVVNTVTDDAFIERVKHKASGVGSWLSERVNSFGGDEPPRNPERGERAAAYLQTLSTGKMQGMGSTRPVSAPPASPPQQPAYPVPQPAPIVSAVPIRTEPVDEGWGELA